MDPFQMVVSIVVIGCLAGVINNWIKTRDKVDKVQVERSASESLGRIRALEQRIEVLEKIITDKRYELNRQLQDL